MYFCAHPCLPRTTPRVALGSTWHIAMPVLGREGMRLPPLDCVLELPREAPRLRRSRAQEDHRGIPEEHTSQRDSRGSWATFYPRQSSRQQLQPYPDFPSLFRSLWSL